MAGADSEECVERAPADNACGGWDKPQQKPIIARSPKGEAGDAEPAEKPNSSLDGMNVFLHDNPPDCELSVDRLY